MRWPLSLPLEEKRHWIVPVFDTYDGNGGKLKYHIVGFAEFVPTAYDFSSSKQYPPGYSCPDGSHKCLKGKFIKYTALGHGDSTRQCNTDGTNMCAIWMAQ